MTLPAVLLLPPIGHEASLWDDVVSELRGVIDVFAYDYPLFGRNEVPFDYSSPDLMARIVEDVLAYARLSERTFSVVGGASLGGTLAFPLEAALSPKALLLVASSGLPVAFVRKDALRSAIRDAGPTRFAREHLGMDPEWSEARAFAATALLAAALEIDFRDAMQSRDRRAAIVFGDEDRIFPNTHPERLLRAVRGATLSLLPGVGHFPPREAPRALAEILLSLVSEERRHDRDI